MHRWASRVLAPGGRYFVLRIEDLALAQDNRPVLRELARFLNAPADEAAVAAAALLFQGHGSSYGGERVDAQDKAARNDKLGASAIEALRTFGYELPEGKGYGLAQAFDDAPACGIVSSSTSAELPPETP